MISSGKLEKDAVMPASFSRCNHKSPSWYLFRLTFYGHEPRL